MSILKPRIDGRYSVAMATYCGEKYILAQLKSIEEQSLHPAEVIISDDRSGDATVQRVEEFARTSSLNIRLLKQETNLGVLKNFLAAFEACRTPYIIYCDQDDVWLPGKMAAYSRVLDKDPQNRTALVYHFSRIVDSELQNPSEVHPKGVKPGFYPHPHIPDTLWGYGHQMMFSAQTFKTLKELLRTDDPRLEGIRKNLDLGLMYCAGMVGDIRLLKPAYTLFRRHAQAVSPSGKPLDQAKAGPVSRGDRISQLLSVLNALTLLTDQLPLAVNKEAYQGAVQKLERVYRLRTSLYHSPADRGTRLKSFLRLLFLGAYGSPRQNKLPPRLIIVDLLRLFRPA